MHTEYYDGASGIKKKKNLWKRPNALWRFFFQMFLLGIISSSFYTSSTIKYHVQLDKELVKKNNFLPLNILLSMY